MVPLPCRRSLVGRKGRNLGIHVPKALVVPVEKRWTAVHGVGTQHDVGASHVPIVPDRCDADGGWSWADLSRPKSGCLPLGLRPREAQSPELTSTVNTVATSPKRCTGT